jgi:hypothetical protein
MGQVDDADRAFDAQEEREPDKDNRVEILEEQQRDDDAAEADFDIENVPETIRHFEVITALSRAAFRGEDVDMMLEETDEISADERAALAILDDIVRGRDDKTDGLIYAEQRLELLNRVLAVLSPTLSMGLSPELAEFRDEYDDLVEQASELRDRLEKLDSAQEEIWEQDRERGGEAPDTDDKPPDDSGADAAVDAAKPSTLTGKPGEPAVEKPSTPSTLAGKPGEPAVEKPKGKSTVWDGD